MLPNANAQTTYTVTKQVYPQTSSLNHKVEQLVVYDFHLIVVRSVDYSTPNYRLPAQPTIPTTDE